MYLLLLERVKNKKYWHFFPLINVAFLNTQAPFLSLNMHALAEQLAKANVSKRLFAEPDLLTLELVLKISATLFLFYFTWIFSEFLEASDFYMTSIWLSSMHFQFDAFCLGIFFLFIFNFFTSSYACHC